MRQIQPWAWLIWLGLICMSVLGLGVTYFVGIFAPGKDINETCAKAGQILDDGYRSQNWKEPGQLFPLHNKCNAYYDIIPAWVNPTLVTFALLTLVLLGAFIVSIITSWKRRAYRSSANETP